MRKPVIVIAVGALALVWGVALAGMALVASTGDAHDIPEELASLSWDDCIMMLAYGSVLAYAGVGFIKGWPAFWYIGLGACGVAAAVSALMLAASATTEPVRPADVGVSIALLAAFGLAIKYMLTEKVKRHFLGRGSRDVDVPGPGRPRLSASRPASVEGIIYGTALRGSTCYVLARNTEGPANVGNRRSLDLGRLPGLLPDGGGVLLVRPARR